MGVEKDFSPVCLVMGVLYTDSGAFAAVRSLMEETFGPIRSMTEPVSFDFTDYYNEEMGGRPLRLYCLFDRLVDPRELAGIKHYTDSLEKLHRTENGGRKVNLDPGLLTSGNLVLATTKNRSQRIALDLCRADPSLLSWGIPELSLDLCRL